MESTAEMGVMAGLTQGLMGYLLTIVVAFGAACLIWVIVMLLESMKKKQEAAPKPVTVAVAPEPVKVDETAQHVAAIAAAVYAAVGAARLVYIGEAQPGSAWTTTGRTLHQTSHMPKRAPKG